MLFIVPCWPSMVSCRQRCSILRQQTALTPSSRKALTLVLRFLQMQEATCALGSSLARCDTASL